MNMMKNREIRFHGRGGQGAVSSSEMLVAAFAEEGQHSAGFPVFGSERRGAPTTAFVRFGPAPIREKTKIYHPDCLIVFDESQLDLSITYAGLKANSVLIANTSEPIRKSPHENFRLIGSIHATPIALDILGVPAISTCLLGAFAATTKWVRLESVLSILPQYFKNNALEKNIQCVKMSFDATTLMKPSPSQET